MLTHTVKRNMELSMVLKTPKAKKNLCEILRFSQRSKLDKVEFLCGVVGHVRG